jgi:hypothetical protein
MQKRTLSVGIDVDVSPHLVNLTKKWGGAARALPSFANRQQANPQGGGEAEGGFSPSSRISWAMGPSRRMDRGGTR